ncbi:intermembrane transport protein PqiB [Luteolibacter arcticus]|uniref:Intermembrane transport protein PqiB n=1 Tax=Luteolibacter arcticus TaxID=1581411 RepID=A0ABT3GC28_9BACT|nr:intermembrane transport protein PqiB [Luteolibacter arcticus]MCW1921181.1 intermembrane transport protein PqiB [Luteolibacter arcticus]
MTEETQEPRAVIHHRRRWSSVWLVPLLALVVAGGLVWKHYAGRGPIAYVRFETAESIEAGTTEVRCRSVRVGVIERVDLSDDLQSVVAEVRMDPNSEYLLRQGTRFWVVKPRVSGASISGLSTIVSGAYLELEPGETKMSVHHFDGLEEPPVTAASVPGLRLTLVADDAGSLAAGSPIYYRGFEVGRVERRTLDIENRRIRFDIFIEEEFSGLVRQGTCFWNTSGIDVEAGADGFKVSTPSLQAMLSGGAVFSVPKGGTAGDPVHDGAAFELFPDEEAARRSVFTPDHRILLFFDQSVRGLSPGAPVEFRGIPLGRVIEISFKHSPPNDSRVPVVIEIDSETLGKAVEDITDPSAALAECVRRGLRAKLSTGSLLTGALYVDLDFVPGAEPAELAQLGEFEVIPTESSGLAQLQDKLNAILAKIEALPLDETLNKFGNAADEITITVKDVRSTLTEAEGALAEAKKLLARDETQNLTAELEATLKEVRGSVSSLGPQGAMQGDLARTLDELRAALRSFKVLSDSIEEKPNSLLFGREGSGDPKPRAKR